MKKKTGIKELAPCALAKDLTDEYENLSGDT